MESTASLISPFSRLAKVDATVEKKLAKDHEVKGYPTIYYYKKGDKEKYSGEEH